jgi:hypothetical protein
VRVNRWLDIRVQRAQLAGAVNVLATDVEHMSIDLTPPAAGPEVEITVYGKIAALQVMRARLEQAGITVLAERSREWTR